MDPRAGLDPGSDPSTPQTAGPPAGKATPGAQVPEAAASEAVPRTALREQARLHYQRGNRFFDLRLFELALAEWRQAGWIWHVAGAPRRRPRQRLLDLRAVVLLLLTVLLIFNLVYGLFPRNVADLAVNPEETAGEEGPTWWERWLDTGHPAAPGAPSVTLREWWQRMQHRWRTGTDEPPPEFAARPDLDERWAELVQRFRRGAPAEPLDFHMIAGFGFIRSGDYAKAVHAFETGLQGAKLPRHRADLYQGLANAYYYDGYHPGADGLARYDLDRVRQAAEAYERSARAEARALSVGNLGWMYFLLGDYERAEQNSMRALGMEKNLHYVRLNLALTYLVQNRVEDAYAAYRAVIRSQPEEDVLTGGINDLREVMRDHPGSYPYADLMAGLLARAQGDLPRAEASLRKFLKAPDTSLRWRRLAEQALRNLNSPVSDL